MTHTPIDLDGNPYTPILNYEWMTDAHRATCALHMACDPSQIEFRLDARAKHTPASSARLIAALETIALIAEGSRTDNSLPHIARIARSAIAEVRP